MADPQHLTILQQGVEAWNQWRQQQGQQPLDLSDADLKQTDLMGINLSGVDLRSADLRFANLRQANLSWANLRHAKLGGADLHRAQVNSTNLSGANLNGANFSQANLSFANLSCTNLSLVDLRQANLSGTDLNLADLSVANLHQAQLNGANLSEANLQGANLCGAQVGGANFTQANLTGICIQDWQVDETTQLELVDCSHAFQRFDATSETFCDRIPTEATHPFSLTEFIQQQQTPTHTTIEVAFLSGIDWPIFWQSFQTLRELYSSAQTSIQGLENQGNQFIVRLALTGKLDPARVQSQLQEIYHSHLTQWDAQHPTQDQSAWQLVEQARHHNTDLTAMVQCLATQAHGQQTPSTEE